MEFTNYMLKRILLPAIIIIFIVHNCSRKFEESKTKIHKKTNTIIIENKDSIVRNFDDFKERKTIIVYDTIKRIIRKNIEVPVTKNEIQKKLVETKDTIRLKNAEIRSTILSEGKVYEHLVDITTFDKITENTITVEKTVYKNTSTLFLNVEPIFGLNTQLLGGEVSVDYTFRNKFRIGTGVGINNAIPTQNKYYLKAKIGIPLN